MRSAERVGEGGYRGFAALFAEKFYFSEKPLYELSGYAAASLYQDRNAAA
jgi:hypothetical protein